LAQAKKAFGIAPDCWIILEILPLGKDYFSSASLWSASENALPALCNLIMVS
jgi:hypothetical protein